MNPLTERHEPTDEFRANLEREVIRYFRAESRRDLPTMRSRWRRLRPAAVILVALMVGAAAGVGSAQVQDNRQREQLLQAERQELELANMRAELLRRTAEESRARYQTGGIEREQLAEAVAAVAAMEASIARVRLNLEEIQATSLPPRDNLSAPVVNGHDFVRERLQLELAAMQERLSVAEQRAARARQAYNVGITPELALLEREAELVRRRSEMALMVEKLNLRQAYVERRIQQSEVARAQHRAEVEQALTAAQQLLSLATRRAEQASEMRRGGAIEEVELLRMQLELAERQAEVGRLQESLEHLPERWR